MPIYGNIEVYYGPTSIGAPDDLEAVIVGFIDGANRRLEIAVHDKKVAMHYSREFNPHYS